MAESLLFSIAEGVLGKIASPAVQEAVAIYNFENQIRELRETLTAIKAVLSDAEAQKAKNNRLQVWLDRLQQVFYDAEDVLDELECEALRKQGKGKVRRFFSLSNPLVLRAKLSHKVKEIRETLSRISTEKDQFGLKVGSSHNDVAHTRSREMTYSSVNKSDVVGRDVDKEKIIEMLLRPVDDEKLAVIPIVGIGGLGKTALAKLVYNDDSVKEQFKLRMWVCVPEDFNLKKTIEEIIKGVEEINKGATDQTLSNLNVQQLQTRLRDIIKDEKYLLVLDDVWSDDRSRWKELRDLLSDEASESRVIVTTRSSKVASIMGTHPAHNLKGLSHEASMALFKKWAFDEKEKQSRPDLLEIGNDIVKKCRGVPLLVKTLGSLLYSKYDERHWTHVRDSETWELVEAKNDILPVLKLSYDHLPSHLKRCFATFSLFPRGVRLWNYRFVRLWIALGFINSTSEKLALKDVGDDYIRELWKRSLIQEIEENDGAVAFRVHDLVHLLATSVAQNDCSIVSLDTTEISEGVRYISLSRTSSKRISKFDGVLPFFRRPTSKKLRAIIRSEDDDDGFIGRKFTKTCISRCTSLRYLDLSYGSFEELPRSICILKHLRFLSVRGNKQLKKLPNTICELQSLVSLHFANCSELRKLPRNMNRLSSLRFLSITTKQNSLQGSGIQYLENLHHLGIYDCQNLQVLFEGTCRLIRLRQLSIGNCERPIYVPFRELIALDYLLIDNCKLVLTEENKSNFPLNLCNLSILRSEQVMELLQCLEGPAHSLEYFGVHDCLNLIAVPEWLPDHTRLKLIRLIRCPNLSSMPHGIQSLTALEELHIEYCDELSKRCEPQIGEDWQKIAHIPRIILDTICVQWTDD